MLRGGFESGRRCQRRATKMISEVRDLCYEDRLKALDLPSMEYRRRRGDMIQCYKIINGLVRMEAGDLFTRIPSNNTRGHSQRILRTKAHKATRIKTFSQRTIKSWNSLPSEVINAPSINAFKNRLDEAWNEKIYKTSVV